MDSTNPSPTKGARQQVEGGKSRPLSVAQRARKRAADRKFHRNSREKTRTYIAHLEELLRTREFSEDNEQIKKLMHQADQNYLEIHRLRCALRKVSECALSSIEEAGENNHASQAITPVSSQYENICQGNQPSGEVEMPNLHTIEAVENTGFDGKIIGGLFGAGYSDSFDANNIQSMAPSSITPLSVPQGLSLENVGFSSAGGLGFFRAGAALTAQPELLGSSPVIPAVAPVPSHCERNIDDGSIWNQLASLASSVPQFSSNLQQFLQGPFQESNVEDVLVRAIFEGWDAIPQHCATDPTWQAIRCIDQQILFVYDAVARLAMLYVIKLQLHVRSSICCV